MLPESWREHLDHARRRLTMRLEDGEVILGIEEKHRAEELWRFSASSEAPLLRQQLADVLVEHEVLEVPRFLLLDVDEVLVKEMMIPAAAAANLQQVLTFEMDRHTPFQARDVYFDWRIAEQRSDEQIRVLLYAIPRRSVEERRRTLAGFQLAPSGVDVVEQGESMDLNLLPADQRARVVNQKTRMNMILMASAAGLIAVAMWASLALRSHQVEELDEAIAAVRGEAMSVQRIRDQIIDTSKAAGFLTLRRSLSPLAVEVLAEVTRQLPDDTYLDRLVIGTTTIQMQGKSSNAQQLIEVVNDSEMLSAAAFRGSTRLDPRTGLEIFEINADITDAAAPEEETEG